MNTIEKVNVIELASNLAEESLSNYIGSLTEEQYDVEFPNGTYTEEDDCMYYTDEAQDIFNNYYDKYSTMIEECKE